MPFDLLFKVTIASFLIWVISNVFGSVATADTVPAETERNIRISPGFVSQPLSGHMLILRDPNHSFSLEDFVSGTAGENMLPVEGGVSLGYTADILWVKITLEQINFFPSDLFISLKPTYLDKIDLYYPNVATPLTAEDFSVMHFGDHVSSEEGEFFVMSLVGSFSLADAEQVDIYLRIETTSTMSLRGWIASEVGIVGLATAQAVRIVALVVFLITLGTTLMYSWLYLHQPLLISFSSFLLAHALMVVTDGGLLPPGPMIAGRYLVDLITEWAIIFTQITNIYFIYLHLSVPKKFPRLKNFFRISILIFVLSLAAPMFGVYQLVIAPILLTAFSFIVIFFVCNAILYRRGEVGRNIAVLGSFSQVAGAAFALGRLLGILPFEGYTEYAYQVGVVLYTFLMSLSVIVEAKNENQKMQSDKILFASQEAERVAVELVAARTYQLRLEKDRAEIALKKEQESQEEQLRFIDILSHEYQTPLAIIRNSATAIYHSLKNDERENLVRIDRIQAAVSRLRGVFDISLDKSRLQSRSFTADFQSVNARALMESIVRQNQELFSQRNIKMIEVDLDPAQSIDTDAKLLALSIGNLIENAIKFSKPSTGIYLTCKKKGSCLVIKVLDEGIGIPDDEVFEISKRYVRGSNSGNTLGSGLGLHIVQSAVSAIGGKFEIINREVKGVEAIITVPLIMTSPPITEWL